MKFRQVIKLLLDKNWVVVSDQMRHASGTWFFVNLRAARLRDPDHNVVYDTPFFVGFIVRPLASWVEWKVSGKWASLLVSIIFDVLLLLLAVLGTVLSIAKLITPN